MRPLPPVRSRRSSLTYAEIRRQKELQGLRKAVRTASDHRGMVGRVCRRRALTGPGPCPCLCSGHRRRCWRPGSPDTGGLGSHTRRFAAEDQVLCPDRRAEADCVLSRSRRITDLLIEQGAAGRARCEVQLSGRPGGHRRIWRLRGPSLRSELGLNAEIVLGFVGGPFPFWDLEAVARATVELVANGRDWPAGRGGWAACRNAGRIGPRSRHRRPRRDRPPAACRQ